MTQPAEFSAVKKSGRRFPNALFAISALPNDRAHPRLGLAIATRVFRTAVARNRIKRLVRESFRLHQHALPAVDITVAARDAAKQASSPDLRMNLESCWRQIAERM